jgi:hypothetical protein
MTGFFLVVATLKKLFKNVASPFRARRKSAKKRSVHVVHEDFERFFNTAMGGRSSF